jgi:hypothetical protein
LAVVCLLLLGIAVNWHDHALGLPRDHGPALDAPATEISEGSECLACSLSHGSQVVGRVAGLPVAEVDSRELVLPLSSIHEATLARTCLARAPPSSL